MDPIMNSETQGISKHQVESIRKWNINMEKNVKENPNKLPICCDVISDKAQP